MTRQEQDRLATRGRAVLVLTDEDLMTLRLALRRYRQGLHGEAPANLPETMAQRLERLRLLDERMENAQERLSNARRSR